MSIENNYPVFEPDQVLTNKHLNNVVDYLEQQNRLTRTKLVGSGIVCGLDIQWDASVLSISKGSALTSQGYMLLLPCANLYKYYIPYTPPVFPNDLHFIRQCDDDKSNVIPFYTEPYNTGLLRLIGETEFNSLDADKKNTAFDLSKLAAGFLDDFAIVLFFEAEEISLKNCDTNDCNDKGSEMDFEVKVLLVKKQLLDQVKKEYQQNYYSGVQPPSPVLKRYNVPARKLSSSADVLTAFSDLTDDVTIKVIGDALKDCSARYSYLLENQSDKPFDTAADDLKKQRDAILKDNPVLIQYFYDYLDDIIKSFLEFTRKAFRLNSECCMDEMRFPFHIMLGEASPDAAATAYSAYREYFIYSPLFQGQEEKLAGVRSLFMRLKLLIREFSVENITGFDKKEVRITPSRYGHARLSERCIPYYYDAAETGNELYRCWSYDKLKRGLERTNLGYNAPVYSADNPVVHPLEYDIEPFDFFRIEGHIGKPVTNALSIVEGAKQNYNLPFDTIALSADYIGALLRGEEPICLIEDLESDYRLVIAELICTLHDAFCSLYQFAFKPVNNFALAASAGISMDRTAATSVATPVLTNENEEEVSLLMSKVDMNDVKIQDADISAMVGEYQASKDYTKGTLIQKLCGLKAGTIGSSYLSNISATTGLFSNPVLLNTPVKAAGFYNKTFELIDSMESMFLVLMNNELAELDMVEFKKTYARYEGIAKNMYKILTQVTNKVEVFLNTCIVTKLEALKNEYLRRMAQYQLERNFGYYFSKHGGVEHKGGVPKSGTFILVYHEERKSRSINPQAILVNTQIRTLLRSDFHKLLQPAVKVDDLEFQTGLLQVATLYKDPELYLRFKEVLQKYLDECTDLPPDRRTELTGIINRPPQKENFVLTDGMVIADFYVPYLCCSDCPPVAYILPPAPKDDTADPTIKIDKNKFCNDDKSLLPLTVTPAGGTVAGTAGVSVDAAGNFIFSPFGLSAGLYTITYKINNKSAAVTVEITAIPKPKFSLKITINAGVMTVSFINESTDTNDQTVYEWLEDGVTISAKKDPDPVSFKVESLPHVFLLKESNGACPAQSDEVKLELHQRAISVCRNVKTLALESALPAGTTITPVLKGNIMDDQLNIHPADTGITKTTLFNVSYLLNGVETDVAITVVVANADFSMELSQSTSSTAILPVMLTVKSLGDSLSKSTWDIRQGDKTIQNVTDGKPIPLAGFNLNQTIIIKHDVEVKTDTETCTDSKTFNLTGDIIKTHLRKGPFDNNLQP